MTFNFSMIFVAAIVPTLLRFVWYSPAIFGKSWQQASGLTDEKLQTLNKPLAIVLGLVLGIFIAFSMTSTVVHQIAVMQILSDEPNFGVSGEATDLYNTFMSKYGQKFRWWGHGALHGVLSGLFFIAPIIGLTALHERRGFKYVAIHAGFWIVCLAIMGAILCQLV